MDDKATSPMALPSRRGLTLVRPQNPRGYPVKFRCVHRGCALYLDSYVARCWIERGPGGRPEPSPVETDRCLGCGRPGECLDTDADLRAMEREGARA